MKKLLSIFAIGIILGPGIISSGAGIACRSSSKKLDLNSLGAYNLDYKINRFNKIVINPPLVYELAENQIMKEYDLFFNYKQKISFADFVYGLKPTRKHPWAIQIYDLDGNWILNNFSEWILNFKTSIKNDFKTPIKDNGLKVEINTLDKNVKSPQGTFRYFFNKFWYSNKNANKGHNITVDTTKTAAKNNLSVGNVIDLTQGVPNKIPFNLSIKYLIKNYFWVSAGISNQWDHLAPNYKQEIASRFVTNLNFQLKTETNKLNALNKVKIANNNVDVKNSQNFFNLARGFYSVYDKTGYPEQIDEQYSSPVIGENIYVQLDISHWNYLKNYLLIPGSHAFAYLYLGKFTK